MPSNDTTASPQQHVGSTAELGGAEPWVCPWGICGHEDAQKCRANKEHRKRTQRGCGTYFMDDVTPAEARRMVAPPNQN